MFFRWAENPNQSCERRPKHVLHRAAEENHEALDHDHHVAIYLWHVEGELGTTLVKRAKENRREDDAQRVITPHQRNRDAHETRARRKIDHQAMLRTQEFVESEAPRERTGKEHRTN